MATETLSPATASELADAHQEPVLHLGRLTYRGRLLSIEEWLPFFERRLALEAATERALAAKRVPDLRPWVEHWIAYLRAVFPRRRFRVWAPDAVDAIRSMPGTALREHYERFFRHQARALGMFPGSSLPTTSGAAPGTDSPSRTAAGASDPGGA